MPHTVEQSRPHQTLHQQSTHTQHKIPSSRRQPVRETRQRGYEVVKRLRSWDWSSPHCEHSFPITHTSHVHRHGAIRVYLNIQFYWFIRVITERSERLDRVFVRLLCELLKLLFCLLEWVQLHRRLQGCQTKWATFTKRDGSHKSTVVPDSMTHQVNLCVDLK
jgi:hypothetical protein